MITKTLKIVPTGYPANRNFVQGVKSVRTLTGLGLREAKDIMDAVCGNNHAPLNNTFTLQVYPENLTEFVAQMRNAGYDVTDMTIDWLAGDILKVRDLMMETIQHKNYRLAKRLLDVLEEFS